MIVLLATISNKIVETLYSNGVTSENKAIHTSLFKVWVFLEVSSNSGTALHGGDRGGKAIFSPFEVCKTSESPFRGEVSQQILSAIAGNVLSGHLVTLLRFCWTYMYRFYTDIFNDL